MSLSGKEAGVLLLLQEVAPVQVPGKKGIASSPVMTDDALLKVGSVHHSAEKEESMVLFRWSILRCITCAFCTWHGVLRGFGTVHVDTDVGLAQ